MAGGRKNLDRPDHWSDIVGMPDDWDKKNLRTLIDNFYKEKFELNDKVITGKQWTKLEVEDARKKHGQDVEGDHGVKIESSEMRIGTAMPNVLWTTIEAAYPTIFRDTDHLNWFIQNFPEFKVVGKW